MLPKFPARWLIALLLSCAIALACMTVAQALLGDLDISGLVDQDDMAVIDRAYDADLYATPAAPDADWRADLNDDRLIDVQDLTLAGRNFGQMFNFHWARRASNGLNGRVDVSNPVELDAAVDSAGQVHVIWVENTTSEEPLFYTVLDPAGNPLIEDVELAGDASDVRIAVDGQNAAHVVWHPRYSQGGIFYTKIDAEGSTVVSPVHVCENCGKPAIATDQYNHAHLFYRGTSPKLYYAVLGADGLPLMPGALINTQYASRSVSAADGLAISIGADGSRHLLWHEYTTQGGDVFYSRINLDGSVALNQVVFTHYQGTYNERRVQLRVDSQNAAHVVFYDNRGTPGSLYWRRIDSAGSLSTERLVTDRATASAGLDVALAIDPSDRLHLVSYYKNSNGEIGYASLDRDGNPLTPYQRLAYAGAVDYAITLDGDGNAMLVTRSEHTDLLGGKPLVVLSTLVDVDANDTARADLVLDGAHLSVPSQLLKITDDAEITLSVTNGGWMTAQGNQATFSFPDVAGARQTIVVPLDDLEPFESVSFSRTIPVPDMEDTVTWPVTVSVSSATPETSLTNNSQLVRFGVTPPPKAFNLEVLPYDETYAPGNPAAAAPFPGAVLTVSNTDLGIQRTIDPSEAFNVFYSLPLDLKSSPPLYPTSYRLTLTAPGYSVVTQTITAQRQSEANPYAITVDPANPVALYINSWGSIAGELTGPGGEIEGASIWLENGQSAVSDAAGRFLVENVPAGDHHLRIWAKKYEPVPAVPVAVVQGQATPFHLEMQETMAAEIGGQVTDEFGNTLPNVTVRLTGDPGLDESTATDVDGFYTIRVDPFEGYSNLEIHASQANYAEGSASAGDMQPGLPVTQDFSLVYNQSGDAISQSGEVTSWNQNETWCKSTGDDVPWTVKVLEFIGSKWCPDYSVGVDWGEHDYRVSLDYTLEGSTRVLHSFTLNFENPPFMDYTVSGGMFSGGGETRDVTAERVDWVELIALDSAGNPVGDPLWADEEVWYSSVQADPANATRRIAVNNVAMDGWSSLAIRVFYTVGQYAELEDHRFENWNAPAEATLAGVGGASGADRQAITWRLSPNTVEHTYAMVDYRSAAGMLSAPLQAVEWEAANEPLADVITEVYLEPAVEGPARLGTPYVVYVRVKNMAARPVYGVEFSLSFSSTYLMARSVCGAEDFSGPYGTFARTLALPAGTISDAAVVRLGAPAGLTDGYVARVELIPRLKRTTSTTLDLNNVKLVDIEGDDFFADHIGDTSIPSIEDALTFIPLVVR